MQRETNRIIVNKSKIYPNRSSLEESEKGKWCNEECNKVLLTF